MFTRKIPEVGIRFSNIVRFSNTITNYEVLLKPKFTKEEQQKILNVLNESDTEYLRRFNVPQNRIKRLSTWKKKQGPFQKLTDVLEVDGLSVKVLEKLCEDIITNKTNILVENIGTTYNKSRKQFLVPALTYEQIENLQHAVGICLTPTGISWTKITRDNHLRNWDFYGFGALPTKVLPHETFQLAVKILNHIPCGDVYVFEGAGSNIPNGKTTSISSQQLELTAMLLALLNTSKKHNCLVQNGENNSDCYQNKVFYLRSRLPARLFGTLVGQEKVSALNSITSILDKSSIFCGTVNLDERIKQNYLSQSSINKELLGQSLMLAITFMELCIHKNENSIKAVAYRGK